MLTTFDAKLSNFGRKPTSVGNSIGSRSLMQGDGVPSMYHPMTCMLCSTLVWCDRYI